MRMFIFDIFKENNFGIVEVVNNLYKSQKQIDCSFDDFWNIWKITFGGRFINIGLEKSAVAAASVVEEPSRCSNKGSKASMFIKRLRESFLFTASEARAGGRPSPALKAPESYRAISVWGIMHMITLVILRLGHEKLIHIYWYFW